MRLLDRLFKTHRPVAAELPTLAADERVTAWGATPDGDAVVATQLGLWVRTGESSRRLGWHDIHKAAWAEGVLTVTPGVEVEPGVVADAPALRLRLAEPGDLPAEVRSRVSRSVAFSSHHRLPAGGGVRVVARRVPGEDGLTWVLRFDEQVDRADPAVRERAAAALDTDRSRVEHGG